MRIVLLFISIHDRAALCHFWPCFSSDIGYCARSGHNHRLLTTKRWAIPWRYAFFASPILKR
ncbi:hypothetical protein CRX51_11800 [Pluralibacter gergoviae]|nr:hypothetical protein CRX51_11800 [Pluralibacter gergoviae]